MFSCLFYNFFPLHWMVKNMNKRSHVLATLALVTTVLAQVPAYSGVFDDINKALDTVKKGTAMLPGAPADPFNSSTPYGGTKPGGAYSNRNAMLPMDLVPYPRAKLHERIDNPLERLVMPLTTPVHTPEGYVSALATPMQGRVTMLTYSHYEDDSPLLIRQHYESWIASQGFERLLVCEAPCKALPFGYNWRQMVDPTNRLDANYIPSEPTFVAGFKQGAMVIVGIGKNNGSYSSLIKMVEGQILDERQWLAATAKRAPLAAVPLVRSGSNHVPYPAPPSPSSTRVVIPVAQQSEQTEMAQQTTRQDRTQPAPSRPTAANSATEEITPDQLTTRLAGASGVTVVHFSSNDPGCSFCVRSNARFDTLAKSKAGQATFLRVMWHPYVQVFDDPLAVQYNLVGLPTFIAFKGTTVARRVDGDHSAVELSNKLMAR